MEKFKTIISNAEQGNQEAMKFIRDMIRGTADRAPDGSAIRLAKELLQIAIEDRQMQIEEN